MEPLRLGLVGYPLGHSRSPAIHKAALRALGIEGEYRLYAVEPLPEGGQALGELCARVRRGEIDGLNVTIPHKQSIVALMDELAPTARAIGAVNTIIRRGERLVGDNTDGQGFMADLGELAPDLAAREPSERVALVLGAGGSARAVVWALLNGGWRVSVAARRIEQAQELVISYQSSVISDQSISYQLSANRNQSILAIQLDPVSLSSLITDHRYPITLVVNCTPVGMSPNITNSPWPEGTPFPEGAVVYDLVYIPAVTRWMGEARRAGLIAFNGLGMLVEQAALAFELWSGRPAPREAMRAAALEAPVDGSGGKVKS